MKRLLSIGAAGLLLAGCAQPPEPIVDYDVPYLGKGDVATPAPPPTPPCTWFFGLFPCPDGQDDPRDPDDPDDPRDPDDPDDPRDPDDPDDPRDPDDPDDPGKDKKEKGNNGWGNGDQPAPGNSGPNNNAENDKGKRNQNNHGGANPN